jgi:hypothetical protein
MAVETVLSLAELEAFDPAARPGKRERPFLCPFCGHTKPMDAAHRSLKANMESGLWNCHRCHQQGKLHEWWQERPHDEKRIRTGTRRRVSKLVLQPLTAPESPGDRWDRPLAGMLPLPNTPGAAYVVGRAIPLELAVAAQVRYQPRWESWVKPAERWERAGVSRRVVFPVRSPDRQLLAAQGRAISASEFGPKVLSAGRIGSGVYATPGAWDLPVLTVTEAPFDALSLHVCGLPSLATLGSHLPDWLPRACRIRPVVIATDADEGGDKAAEAWAARLRPLVSSVHRLRPVGHKDWNAWLMADPDGLQAFLHAEVRSLGLSASVPILDVDAEIHRCIREAMESAAEILHGVDHHPGDALSEKLRRVDLAADAANLVGVRTACSEFLATARSMAAGANRRDPQVTLTTRLGRPIPPPPCRTRLPA